MSANSYATDGRCHNAEPGSYGHECGKPATWIGTNAKGFTMGYCDRCKAGGAEARDVMTWERTNLGAARLFSQTMGMAFEPVADWVARCKR